MRKISCKRLNIKDIMRSGLADFPFMNSLFHSGQDEMIAWQFFPILPFHYNN